MKVSNKKMKEEDIKKMIEAFNTDFKTKIKSKNMIFLSDIFNNFVTMDWSEVEDGENQIHKMSEIEDELLKKLDDKGKELFKEWNKTQDNYTLTITEQAFIYGACFMMQLGKETMMGGEKQ